MKVTLTHFLNGKNLDIVNAETGEVIEENFSAEKAVEFCKNSGYQIIGYEPNGFTAKGHELIAERLSLTDNELKMLENFMTNDYGDGNDKYDWAVWSNCWDCGIHGAFCNPLSAPGIIGSLVKKGVFDSDGETFYLTEFGKLVAITMKS